MYSPRGNKLKYLKYIRLRLQDHHRSFKHASVYRINRIQNVFFFFFILDPQRNELVSSILCTTLSTNVSHKLVPGMCVKEIGSFILHQIIQRFT